MVYHWYIISSCANNLIVRAYSTVNTWYLHNMYWGDDGGNSGWTCVFAWRVALQKKKKNYHRHFIRPLSCDFVKVCVCHRSYHRRYIIIIIIVRMYACVCVWGVSCRRVTMTSDVYIRYFTPRIHRHRIHFRRLFYCASKYNRTCIYAERY